MSPANCQCQSASYMVCVPSSQGAHCLSLCPHVNSLPVALAGGWDHQETSCHQVASAEMGCPGPEQSRSPMALVLAPLLPHHRSYESKRSRTDPPGEPCLHSTWSRQILLCHRGAPLTPGAPGITQGEQPHRQRDRVASVVMVPADWSSPAPQPSQVTARSTSPQPPPCPQPGSLTPASLSPAPQRGCPAPRYSGSRDATKDLLLVNSSHISAPRVTHGGTLSPQRVPLGVVAPAPAARLIHPCPQATPATAPQGCTTVPFLSHTSPALMPSHPCRLVTDHPQSQQPSLSLLRPC